ncbi:zinc finger protein 208-like [Gigantopelta aegis]|uniref:zinc finger protein 208-like n=1 Tax=Gigantopelta aegis TaxID=1735272 RepID=UPI001B88C572|nr:zinc finger protein 208-like [Gigantopelta aegis]
MKNEHSKCEWSLVSLHIVRVYKCVICCNEITKRKTLNLGSSLAQLIGEFKKWESFKCKFCEKTFGQKYSLAVHKRVHTDSKPYLCVLCESDFFTFSGLELHKKIHCCGEKAFTVMKTKAKEVSVPVTRSKSAKHVDKISKASLSQLTKPKKIKVIVTGGNRHKNKNIPKKTKVEYSGDSKITEVEKEGGVSFPNAETNQKQLQKQATSVSLPDMSPFVETANGCLSDSAISQVEEEASDVKTKGDAQHPALQGSQDKVDSDSESVTDLPASKKLKALVDLSDQIKHEGGDSLPKSETVVVNEPAAKKDKPNKDSHHSSVSDADEIFHSEDSDISFEEFKVTSKDHKYNTRHIDPKKSYKKLLPRLKNERKRIKVRKCSLCPHSFFSKETLKAHMLEHKKNRVNDYQCDICKKMFNNKSKMEIHKQIHSGDQPFNCLDCDLSFSSREKLDVHNRIHTGEKPYRCDCCSKEFRCRTYLKQHLRLHRSSKDYRCSTCDKGFHMEKYLKNHMASAQIQICHICKKSFCSAPQLNAHVKEHGEVYPYPCELCKKRFKVQNNYLLHCRIKHNVGDAPLRKKYSCDLCPTTFYKLRQMTVHMENVHNKVKETVVLVCPWSHCGRKFTSEKRLNIHVRSHNGEKSYLCYKCGVNFKDYVYFRKHRARCLQKRKGAFACDICGTVLTEMGSLRVHKRIHTGEKPYQCDLCGTWFRTPSHLKRHELIHLRNKDKPIRRRMKHHVPVSSTFVVKTEKEDVEDMSTMVSDSRHLDRLEFIATGEPSETEDRKPVFDTTGVQTVSATDVNELLFASQIVQEVMATSHIKKEPNETHYIVISQEPDANDENQHVTYLTQEQYGLLPDDQVTYITQGQQISDEQITFITQGQEVISPNGQITYVTEAQDVSSSDNANQEVIGDVLELQESPAHNDRIAFTLTSNEGDHTRYVVINPDVPEGSVIRTWSIMEHLPHTGRSSDENEAAVCLSSLSSSAVAYPPGPWPTDMSRMDSTHTDRPASWSANETNMDNYPNKHSMGNSLPNSIPYMDPNYVQRHAPWFPNRSEMDMFANKDMTRNSSTYMQDTRQPVWPTNEADMGSVPSTSNIKYGGHSSSSYMTEHKTDSIKVEADDTVAPKEIQENAFANDCERRRLHDPLPPDYTDFKTDSSSIGDLSTSAHNNRNATVSQASVPNEHLECKWTLCALKIVKVYKCELCQKLISRTTSLSLLTLLSQHAGNVNASEPTKCSVCEKSFSHTASLKIHKRSHTGQKPYRCDVCKKAFTTSSGLLLHRKSHAEQLELADKLGLQKTSNRVTRSAVWQVKRPRTNVLQKPLSADKVPVRVSNRLKMKVGNRQHFKKKLLLRLKKRQPLQQARLRTTFKTELPKVCVDRFFVTPEPTILPDGKKLYECTGCGKGFLELYKLRIHYRTHSGEKPYSCDHCEKKFARSDKLKLHKMKVHKLDMTPESKVKLSLPNDPNISDLDLLKFNMAYLKDQYVDAVDDDTSPNYNPRRPNKTVPRPAHIPCTFCDRKFNSAYKLKLHIRSHTGEKPYKCETCQKAFRRLHKLTEHKRVHTGEKPYTCDQCEKRFARYDKLKMHKRTHTGEKPFFCEWCGRNFARLDHLKIHTRQHTGERPYKCDQCDKSFTEPSGLKSHKKNFHLGEKALSCQYCDEKFRVMSALQAHTMTHTGQDPYPCNSCDKKFCSLSSLYSHKIIHTGAKFYTCELCGKQFRQKFSLDEHVRLHTGVKPFKCEICGESFVRLKSLQFHIRNHTGEKPFQCDTCGKCYARSANLREHQMHHTGEKPFKCDTCYKTFTASSKLSRHMLIHSGVKACTCTICGKQFSRRDNLNAHMRSHAGEKPYSRKPKESPKALSTSTSLADTIQQHMRIHFGDMHTDNTVHSVYTQGISEAVLASSIVENVMETPAQLQARLQQFSHLNNIPY